MIRDVMIFQLGADAFALDVGAVNSIESVPDHLRAMDVKALPDGAQMRVSGDPIPVVDIRSDFGSLHTSRTSLHRILVIDVSDIWIGLYVDGIHGISTVRPDDIHESDRGETTRRPVVGWFKSGNRRVRLLDHMPLLLERAGDVVDAVVREEIRRGADHEAPAHVGAQAS